MRYFSVCLKKAITPKVFIMLLKSILALIFSVTTTVLATIERNDFINENVVLEKIVDENVVDEKFVHENVVHEKFVDENVVNKNIC